MQTGVRHAVEVLTAGAIAGTVAVTLSISYGTLVFRGDLESSAPLGVGLALFGALTIGLVTALTSGFEAPIAGPQGTPAVVVGLAAASIASSAGPDATVDTVIAFIIVASVSTGLVLFLLGQFGIGGLVRFLPFPVVVGFLGGTGILVIQSTVEVVIGRGGFDSMAEADVVALWLPSLLLGLTMATIFRKDLAPHISLPILIVGGSVAFQIVLAFTGIDREDAASRGWTLGPLPDGSLWPADAALSLGRADWGVIADQAISVGAILVVTTVAVLLHVTGLETELETEVDINRELRGVGLSNLAAGAGGGMPGFVYLADTTIVAKLARPVRAISYVSLAVVVLAMIVGAELVAVVPVAVSAAMLFSIGITFTVEWVIDSRKRLSRSDHLLVLLIVASIAVLGFLPGLGIGIVVAIGLFVVRYSRTDVIRHQMDGRQRRSNVVRDHAELAVLDRHGDEVAVLELQGFVFFGTGDRILTAVRDRLEEEPPLHEVFLGFRRVTGVDSSVAVTFAKIARLGQANRFTVHLVGMTDTVVGQFGEDLHMLQEFGVKLWSDLDRGLEAAEHRILNERIEGWGDGGSWPVASPFEQILGADSALERYLKARTPVAVEDGQDLLIQGEASTGLYFLADGRLVVQGDGGRNRQRLLEAGSMVGEMGWYLGVAPTRTVSADGRCLVHHLDPDTLNALSEDEPQVNSDLQLFVIRTLAERLGHANDVVQHLLR